jgi:hypothetical protein
MQIEAENCRLAWHSGWDREWGPFPKIKQFIWWVPAALAQTYHSPFHFTRQSNSLNIVYSHGSIYCSLVRKLYKYLWKSTYLLSQDSARVADTDDW